jgi:hypothetical protein
MIEGAIRDLTAVVGTSAACAALGRTRQTHYRWRGQVVDN